MELGLEHGECLARTRSNHQTSLSCNTKTWTSVLPSSVKIWTKMEPAFALRAMSSVRFSGVTAVTLKKAGLSKLSADFCEILFAASRALLLCHRQLCALTKLHLAYPPCLIYLASLDYQ